MQGETFKFVTLYEFSIFHPIL